MIRKHQFGLRRELILKVWIVVQRICIVAVMCDAFFAGVDVGRSHIGTRAGARCTSQ